MISVCSGTSVIAAFAAVFAGGASGVPESAVFATVFAGVPGVPVFGTVFATVFAGGGGVEPLNTLNKSFIYEYVGGFILLWSMIAEIKVHNASPLLSSPLLSPTSI